MSVKQLCSCSNKNHGYIYRLKQELSTQALVKRWVDVLKLIDRDPTSISLKCCKKAQRNKCCLSEEEIESNFSQSISLKFHEIAK